MVYMSFLFYVASLFYIVYRKFGERSLRELTLSPKTFNIWIFASPHRSQKVFTSLYRFALNGTGVEGTPVLNHTQIQCFTHTSLRLSVIGQHFHNPSIYLIRTINN